jgi:hypothetical protein
MIRIRSSVEKVSKRKKKNRINNAAGRQEHPIQQHAPKNHTAVAATTSTMVLN